MKIIESYQVPEGNISPDIFKLPCVNAAIKHDQFGIIYRLYDSATVGDFLAIPTDWICKSANGGWYVLTDGQYREFYVRE